MFDQIEYNRKYRKDHPEKFRKYRKTTRKEHGLKNQKYIRKYKLKVGCQICGYNKCVRALEFHHILGEKNFTIAESYGRHTSLEKVKKEMKKCIVVCSNCHREIHSYVADI